MFNSLIVSRNLQPQQWLKGWPETSPAPRVPGSFSSAILGSFHTATQLASGGFRAPAGLLAHGQGPLVPSRLAQHLLCHEGCFSLMVSVFMAVVFIPAGVAGLIGLAEGTTQVRSSHLFFSFPGPPNFLLSKQNLHSPQSFIIHAEQLLHGILWFSFGVSRVLKLRRFSLFLTILFG